MLTLPIHPEQPVGTQSALAIPHAQVVHVKKLLFSTFCLINMSPINHFHLGIALYLFDVNSATTDDREQAIFKTRTHTIFSMGSSSRLSGRNVVVHPGDVF